MTLKKPLFFVSVLVMAALVVGLATPTWANVFASNMKQTGDRSFSYILNEGAGTGVQAQVWQVGGGMVYSQDLGAQTKGLNTWNWSGVGGVVGGNYKIKVAATGANYSGWTKTSVNSTQNNFFLPLGVAVNKNQNSQYFGRVYVSESAGGLTTTAPTNSRTTQDGLYLLNADFSDAVGQGNTARKGGVAWGTTNSPWRVEVGPDNNLYVADWSDSHSGLWMGDPDFVSASEILDSTGRAASGLNVTHGSIDGFVVEGTGADRKIYTMDEDMGTPATQTNSIWRYDIGTSSLFTGAPSAIVYNDAANGDKIMNSLADIIHASDGTWWATQNRSGNTNDTLGSLLQIAADGSTVLWKSVTGLAANSMVDPLKKARGLAYDPVNNILAVTTNNVGKVQIFDPVGKTVIATITTVSNAINNDAVFDAAGNLYIVDSNNERLSVWSPSGANSFTAESWFSFAGVPEPSSLLALLAGLPGLLMFKRRRH